MHNDYTVELENGKHLYYLENALITPTKVNIENRTFSGCVYDRSGRLVSVAQRTKNHVAWKPTDPDQLPSDVDIHDVFEEKCIYLGHYSGHYGHFLLETLSRFWILQQNIDYDWLIFQPFIHDIPHPSTFSPARVSFESFNINPKKIVVARNPTRCKHLIVPNALVEINNFANPAQATVYKQIAEYCNKISQKRNNLLYKILNPTVHSAQKHHRLYLSRRKLKSSHYIKNEAEVEKMFRNFGFHVIYPETLDFRDQVTLYNKAEVLAGFSGSALHNSVFLQKGALVITLGDLRRPSENHPNQKLSDALSGAQSVFVEFQGTTIDATRKIGWFDIDYLQNQLKAIL